MKALRFGSVCSGIEAASVAWGPLGWEAAWFSEIEPFPCAVLAHHYPDVPNLGDMTKLPEMIASHKVEAPDLFCGGTPCQAFSVAGLRQSLADDRGNLSLTFVEIANAIDDVRRARGEPESIVFWENVPGVLSTKDNAFGCFLGALAGSDSALVPIDRWTDSGVVAGPKRTVAWRTLDAQYFGLAQRRRRVFVVASAREGFDPAAVLLEWEGLRRDTAPSRQTGKVTPTISASGTGVSRVGFNCEDEWFISMCLNAGGMGRLDAESETLLPVPLDLRNAGRDPEKHDEMNRQGVGVGDPGDPAHTVTSAFVHGVAFVDVGATLKGGSGERGYPDPSDGNGHNIVAQTVAVAQPMVTNSLPHTFKIRQGSEGGGKGYLGQDDKAFTISTGQDQYLAQPMVLMDQGGSVMNVEHDITGTLRRETHGHEPVVMQPVAFYDYLGSQGGGVEIGISPTLKKKDGVAVTQPVAQPVAVGTDCYNGQITGDVAATMGTPGSSVNASGPTVMVAPTLTAANNPSRSPQSSEVMAQVAAVFEATAYDILGTPASEVAKKADVHTPLRARTPGQFENSTVTMAVQAMQVRRLTCVECERLQGFPDNYTNIPWRKQPESPDGPRYKALGNSWAVPVVRWIGNRIAKNLRFEQC